MRWNISPSSFTALPSICPSAFLSSYLLPLSPLPFYPPVFPHLSPSPFPSFSPSYSLSSPSPLPPQSSLFSTSSRNGHVTMWIFSLFYLLRCELNFSLCHFSKNCPMPRKSRPSCPVLYPPSTGRGQTSTSYSASGEHYISINSMMSYLHHHHQFMLLVKRWFLVTWNRKTFSLSLWWHPEAFRPEHWQTVTQFQVGNRNLFQYTLPHTSIVTIVEVLLNFC